MVNGVLPYQEIRDMIKSGAISSENGVMNLIENFNDDQIGPASFEPSLGDRIFCMPASILPCEEKNLLQRLETENHDNDELTSDKTTLLHKGNVYVLMLNERLKLNNGLIGESTGRSTVGRTNTILRLLTNTHKRYNYIPSGYEGMLFLEIFNPSFSIRVKKGLRLNQIKFANNDFMDIDEMSLRFLHDQKPILYDEGGDALKLDGRIEKDSVVMNLRLNGTEGRPIVYRAKRNVPTPLDFSRDFSELKNKYERREFWEEEFVKDGRIILSPNEFYIMITKERISVPPGYVTKMVPYDSNLADLKTQEADLFNPGHGYLTRGFCPVLEIKPYGQPIELRDNYPICRIKFQKLRAEPEMKLYDKSKETYVEQVEVNPGKMFGK